MLLITKGKEPDSLTAYRKTPFATYDGCNKTDIRKSLLKEQGYLCAYCMRRIREDSVQIEHWYPESKLDEICKLDYSNMLGVCSGHISNLPGRYDTCDAQKGDKIITVDPRKEEHIQKIEYRSNGEIFSNDPVIEEDIENALNLNCKKQYLPQNRKAVLDEIIRVLSSRHKTGTWTKHDILPMIRIFENNGEERKEFAGVALWYLNKLIRHVNI